jgi:hypothetical protein
MDILGFGTPELLLVISIVVVVAVVAYVIKAVRKGIAAAKEE